MTLEALSTTLEPCKAYQLSALGFPSDHLYCVRPLTLSSLSSQQAGQAVAHCETEVHTITVP